MSFHRENVIWKSRNGDWFRGFYEATVIGDDPEWDVDYDRSRFQWAAGPFKTKNEARESWGGSNPGGWWAIGEPSERTDQLDRMYEEFRDQHPPEQWVRIAF